MDLELQEWVYFFKHRLCLCRDNFSSFVQPVSPRPLLQGRKGSEKTTTSTHDTTQEANIYIRNTFGLDKSSAINEV